FSRYPTFDPSLVTLLGEFPHSNNQPLSAGASYTNSTDFFLPKGIGGTDANPQPFYLYVITDPRGAVFTQSRDNNASRQSFTTRGYEDPTNNLGAGSLPVIYREPDVQVTNLLVPQTPPHSGDAIAVTWTVTNLGTRDTREGSWKDRVFLSRDP